MSPEAKYIKPGNDISWLVKQYEIIRYKGSKNLTDKFVPREDVSLVFNFGSLPHMIEPVAQEMPSFFIASLSPVANQIMLEGETDTLIICCKPTVLSRVLGISMLADERVYIPLADSLFRPLWEEMGRNNDAAPRIEAFRKFIHGIQPGRYLTDTTDLLYESILRKGIKTPLQEIVGEFGISERTVQRKFRERLGITPKMLIRIIRINYIWQKITAGRKIDYQDLVFLGNYYDQTHFIKDFKSITGETPDRFFKRNLDITRILSGR